MNVIIKECSKCKIEYPLTIDYFSKSMLKKNSSQCKCCVKAYRKKHYDTNKAKLSKIAQKNYLTHKQERITYRHKYIQENGDKVKKCNKLWRDKNKDRKAEMDREYRRKNREKILACQKTWRIRNAKTIKIKKHEYYEQNKIKIATKHKKNLKSNINARISANLRSRLWSALKAQSCNKSGHTYELIGCSIEFLKQYLENLFLPSMSWSNYGFGSDKWHIDHIIPCANFNLTKPNEQKKCFHYSNLQPLWQPDNFSKNSYYNRERKLFSKAY